ncbi:RNA polymerase sigma factor [Egicoccus halophilus]|uniref:DNA-directed RNA polymerase sigma-70 factor n=1 Tax=Egicoccus halophilus TaxID=1670830 RepID=A0A8J3ACL9_9ACTN|nr:RNA polymerase sigma factor [Egicoccus halophilus]GGI08719.1 DNA-directed RNA polymerase sigma-70 factor [Egicoccus halophilus]
MEHPNNDEDDRELLARLSTDPAAFEAFYRRHVGRVTGFAVRRCASADEVADLVGAVFLAVIESAPRYDAARGEPVGWLFGVAANTLRTQRRRRWRQIDVVGRIQGQRLLDVDDVVRLEERIDAARLADDLRRGVARLPRGERAVLELVAFDGLSPTEAASALGLSPGAARVRLHRARQRLRRELGSPDATEAPPPARTAPPTRIDPLTRTVAPRPIRPVDTEEVAL